MSLRKFTVSIAIVASGIAGGSVAAGSDYPPDVPPPTTVFTSVGGDSGTRPRPSTGEQATGEQASSEQATGGQAQGVQRAGALPTTGSDAGDLLKIAGGVVIAGAGLFAATRRRRHSTAA